jgi:hypothetical protein
MIVEITLKINLRTQQINQIQFFPILSCSFYSFGNFDYLTDFVIFDPFFDSF